MADSPNQIVKISAEIVLGSDPFANAPILTAIGAGVGTAQDAIQQSGGDTTANFKFNVSVEAEKPPRKAHTPAASGTGTRATRAAAAAAAAAAEQQPAS